MKKILDKAFGIAIKFGLPLASILLIVVAINTVAANRHDTSLKEPPAVPPRSPFGERVSSLGILEPRTESIDIGSPMPGLVDKVLVTVGQRVAAGEPLFKLDDRQMRAQLAVSQAELQAAEAQLAKVKTPPRKEEIDAAQARVDDAKLAILDAKNKRIRAQISPGSTSEELRIAAQILEHRAKAQQDLAEADLKLLKTNPWPPDVAVAERARAKAESLVRQVETDLDRLTVRAPVDGNILQVKVHPGESISAPSARSLMVLGDTQRLHVRVSIDEHEIPRFQSGAKAYASVVGCPDLRYPLTFVRPEPFVIPKKSLAGDNRERVDTRVLEVIYELVPPKGAPLFVGQQVNVYIDASNPPLPGAVPTSTQP
jgi:multidrug efflux pump subunit AcrA (membrane-fusion protein)